MGNNCSSKIKEATQKIGQLKSSISQIAKAASNIKKDHHNYVDTTNNKLTQISMAINEQLESIKNLDNDSSATLKEILDHGKIINDIFESMVNDLQSEIDNSKTDEETKKELTEQKQELETIMGEFKEQIKKVEEDIEEDGKGPKAAFGKRKRRRRFGSLYCPKAIKGAYGKGKKKPKKRTTTKRREPVKRRKTIKRRKPTKRKKTVKRRKTAKRRTTTKRRKRSTPNSLSGIFNVINPASISKILQENPDIMEKISDLKVLKDAGRFNTKELVVIAALSTLSEMSVEDASNQFMMLKGSGMSTDSIFDQAIGSTSMAPPAPKKSFLQGMLGGYGRKKVKKKVSKKPSAALKKLCKKHKVRLTVKRGGKRIYKSEKVLKKQCKTAMKKKK